nr:hypothetical protein [Tanacetum cinerariifolium]
MAKVSEDELVGQLPSAHENVQYFWTPASADKHALQRDKNLFHGAFEEWNVLKIAKSNQKTDNINTISETTKQSQIRKQFLSK